MELGQHIEECLEMKESGMKALFEHLDLVMSENSVFKLFINTKG